MHEVTRSGQKTGDDDEEEQFLFFTEEHSYQTTASIALKQHIEQYKKDCFGNYKR